MRTRLLAAAAMATRRWEDPMSLHFLARVRPASGAVR
jgi:hypothetical protein